jgi:hypothetical protein
MKVCGLTLILDHARLKVLKDLNVDKDYCFHNAENPSSHWQVGVAKLEVDYHFAFIRLAEA